MMNKTIKHGDSNLIWFDYNTINFELLNEIVVSNFDITNVPIEFIKTGLYGISKYAPMPITLKNYYVTFFEDHLSNTGYSCMCINKNREIYKSKAGYTNDKATYNIY